MPRPRLRTPHRTQQAHRHLRVLRPLPQTHLRRAGGREAVTQAEAARRKEAEEQARKPQPAAPEPPMTIRCLFCQAIFTGDEAPLAFKEHRAREHGLVRQGKAATIR
jgi:hypothetical protein